MANINVDKIISKFYHISKHLRDDKIPKTERLNMKSIKVAQTKIPRVNCQQCIGAIANPSTPLSAIATVIGRTSGCLNDCDIRRQLKTLAGVPSARQRFTS